ncbi:MAG: hypothetical protein IJZ42_01655 [Lachnospiraceae bacterium]|nr:hypothetical protein [Lachnospiraceae bacterium]
MINEMQFEETLRQVREKAYAAIPDYEKQLVRGTIGMLLARNDTLDARKIEYMVSNFTGNFDLEHRDCLIIFIEREIDQTVKE